MVGAPTSQRRILLALATLVAVAASAAVAMVLADRDGPTTMVAVGAGGAPPTTAVAGPVVTSRGGERDLSRARLPRADEAVANPAVVDAEAIAPTTATTNASAVVASEQVTVQPEQCDLGAVRMPVGIDVLAYATADGLRLRSLDGRTDVAVPGSSGTDLRFGDAAWEPGGTRVAFTVPRSVPPSSAVVVADAASACWRAVSPVGSGQHDQPGWSTDGRVGFRSAGDEAGDGFIGIDVADLREPRSTPVRVLSRASSGPVWAPDRTGRIAYTDGDGLKVFDPASGATRVLHRRIDAEYPVWSPDATRLVFSVSTDPGVWLVRADGSAAAKKISPAGVAGVFGSSWSPDGSRLAFVGSSLPRLASDVWIMDADGGRPVQVTTAGTATGAAVWSPDGRFLAYAVAAEPAIEVLDLLTGDRRTLAGDARPVAFVRRRP